MSFWVSAAVAIAAATADYENNRQVARKQDNELAANLRNQAALQQQENVKTNQLIQKTAQSTPDAAKGDLLGKFMAQIKADGGNATRPLGQAGAVSNAYTKAANDAALGVSDYGTTNANLLSAIDAPAIQRQAEAANLSRYGTQLNDLKRQSSAAEFLSQMRLQSIRPNPWLSAVATGARAYGMARAGGAGEGSASGASDWSQGNTMTGTDGFTYNLPNY